MDNLFAYCSETKQFGEFYKLIHKLDLTKFQLQRKKLPNAKDIKQMFPLVEDDFKQYAKNAKEVAFGNAQPDASVISRLKFALSSLDKKEIDKIARKYLLEHHLLTKRFQGTIQQIVNAFHLLADE